MTRRYARLSSGRNSQPGYKQTHRKRPPTDGGNGSLVVGAYVETSSIQFTPGGDGVQASGRMRRRPSPSLRASNRHRGPAATAPYGAPATCRPLIEHRHARSESNALRPDTPDARHVLADEGAAIEMVGHCCWSPCLKPVQHVRYSRCKHTMTAQLSTRKGRPSADRAAQWYPKSRSVVMEACARHRGPRVTCL
jgi:hypothetical protein